MFKHVFSVTLASLCVSSVASAALIDSFESQTLGSTVDGATVVNTAPGITDGVQAVRTTLDSSSYDKLTSVGFGGVAPGTVFTDFQVDIYAENAEPNGFLQFVAGFFFSSDSSFDQVNGSKELNGVGGDSFIGSTAAGQFTITYLASQAPGAFAKINSEFAAGNGINFGIYANKANAAVGTITVDNFRFNSVPEPGSLALLGLGSLVMLRRRKSA